MKKNLSLSCLILSLQFISCAQTTTTRWVDDIVPDSSLDDPNFKICNAEDQVIQYFNNGQALEYNGEKYAIDSIFFSAFKSIPNPQETGLIRIRFIVNCKGESGRFRMIAMDSEYREREFDKNITEQLMSITKSLKGWTPKVWKETEIDYYQYLIFKLESGKLISILP